MSIFIVVSCCTEQLVGKWVFCLILCGALLTLVFRTTLWPDGSDATYFTPGSALTAANRNITFCLSHCALHLQELLAVSGFCQDWTLPPLLSLVLWCGLYMNSVLLFFFFFKLLQVFLDFFPEMIKGFIFTLHFSWCFRMVCRMRGGSNKLRRLFHIRCPFFSFF